MLDWLIRLYPTRWRQRYGDELQQLVDDLQASQSQPALAVDLLKGAFDAHMGERFAMQSADRQAVKRGMLVAGIVWLALSVEIVLQNVAFPSKDDNDTVSVLVSYLCVFVALFVVGVLAARAGASRTGRVLAGLFAGMTIGALTVATFAVVDNVWLRVVAQQQTKIDGFAHSGARSMRDYINNGLLGGGVLLTVMLGILGAALSLAGGLIGRQTPSVPAPTDAPRS